MFHATDFLASLPDTGLAPISKWELDTPALLLDLEKAASNHQRILAQLAPTGVSLRPHVKIYKATPQLARLQYSLGTRGFTCAKLAQAEVLVEAGFTDILIANEVYGEAKISRLIALAQRSEIIVCVDHPLQAQAINAAAGAVGTSVNLLIEVNIGHNRGGVAPFQPSLELAQLILGLPNLRLRGIMGYDGHCTTKMPASERPAAALKANQLLADASRYLQEHGVPIEIVSGSGSFTYQIAASVPGITEVQAGTYLLMDTSFEAYGVEGFQQTLSVLSTITSRPTYPGAEDLVIIDTGGKAVSTAYGLPAVLSHPGGRVTVLSDEHGRVRFDPGYERPVLGDKIELSVPDSNGTINRFDKFYVTIGSQVVAEWSIPCRATHS